MTQFNWYIDRIKANINLEGRKNVVSDIEWRCEGIESFNNNNLFSSWEGVVKLNFDASTSFVEYDNLSKDQVFAWVYGFIDKSEIESNIQKMIDDQKIVRIVDMQLPWVK
jgi:hypothetical protein